MKAVKGKRTVKRKLKIKGIHDSNAMHSYIYFTATFCAQLLHVTTFYPSVYIHSLIYVFVKTAQEFHTNYKCLTF